MSVDAGSLRSRHAHPDPSVSDQAHRSTAAQQGWATLSNGDLLIAAETAGFEVFVTTDKNIRYQQNLAERRIAIVVIGLAQWPGLEPHVGRVVAAVNDAAPGSYTEVEIPGR